MHELLPVGFGWSTPNVRWFHDSNMPILKHGNSTVGILLGGPLFTYLLVAFGLMVCCLTLCPLCGHW